MQFPQEVLVLILQHVPLQQRLQSCALVQRSWHQAATAATTSITLSADSNNQIQQLVSWLQQPYGQHITALRIAGRDSAVLGDEPAYQLRQALPCPYLIKLELVALQFALGPQTVRLRKQHTANILNQCSGLQDLLLKNCYLHMQQDVMGGLSCVTKLTSLTLDNILTISASKPERTGGSPCLHPVACLHSLQQLNLRNMEFSSHLESFFAGKSRSKCARYHLSFPALTHLDIDICSDVELQEDYTRGLLALTTLQQLRLCDDYHIDPRILESYKAMRDLELEFLSDKGDVAALLAVLPKLQELRSLTLVLEGGYDTDYHGAYKSEALSAFTANTQLQALHLTGVPFPAQTAWQHMFAQGRKLPLLRELTLKFVPEDDNNGSGLQLLASCCFELRQLSLHWEFSAKPKQLLPLTGLQHLSELGLFGASRAVGSVLAQLTQLTKLSVGHQYDDIGLLYLARLTGLKMFCRTRITGAHKSVQTYINTAPPGAVPDVADQIMRFCRDSVHCQPVLELHAQMAEQAAALAATQQQLAHQEQQHAATQEQLAAAQLQLAEREQQLFAAQQEAGELRRQLQQRQVH